MAATKQRQPNRARASEPGKLHGTSATTIKEHDIPSNKTSTSPKFNQRTTTIKLHCPDKCGRTGQKSRKCGRTHKHACQSTRTGGTATGTTPTTITTERDITSNKISTSPQDKQRTPIMKSHCPDKCGRTAQR